MQTSQTAELTLSEYVNKSKLQTLINSGLLKEEWTQEDIDKKHKWFNTHNYRGENEALQNYYNRLDSNGIVQITYRKDSNQGRYKLPNCLSSMKRTHRNYLLCDDYYDFDMVNSCATILLHLGTKHNSKNLRCLKLYVNNRQRWFNTIKKEFKCDDTKAKSLMTALTFGANLTFKDEELNAYKNSLRLIQTELKETHLYDFIETEKSGLSWLAILVQTIEKNIVVELLNYIITNYPQLVSIEQLQGITVAIYELDGFKLLKKNVDDFGGENAVIQIIDEWLCNNSYNTISFISKSMNEKIDLENNELKESSNPIPQETQQPERPQIQMVMTSPVTVTNSFSPIVVEKKSQINPLEILQGLENESFTSGLLSELFLKLYPNDWISNGGVLYGWNGIYWESGVEVNVKITRKIDQDFVDELMKYSQSLPKISEYHIKVIATLIKKISSIRQLSFRKSLIEDITTFSSKNITFNTDPFKLAFNNKIFDLKTGLEIIPNKEDYISITTGYDWIEPTHQQMADLNEIIRKIQPYKDTRDFYLTILSTGLVGIQLQNIFILTGKGGNGKSIIDDLMLSATGNYGYKIPSKLLQEEFKTGVNPEVNNLNYKRFVLGQEPSQSKTICCNVMKELTGSANLNARNIYSSKCDVILLLSLFLECNKLPNLDEVNEAIERRVAVIPFPSKFISDDKYDDLISSGETDETLKTKNIHKKNVEYTTIPFRNANRCALLKILMPYVQTFIECNNNIPKLPNAVKIASSNYLKQSDPIYEWFIENYERKEKSIIYEADIHTNFKSSEYYSKLPKKTQRDLKKENFIDNLKSNLFLSNILQPKLRDEYVDLGLPKTTRIKKDGFYGWAEKSREEEIEVE